MSQTRTAEKVIDGIVADDINVESPEKSQLEAPDACTICLKPFEENPKIECAECSCTSVCLQCFSLGLETQLHRSDHKYRIDRRHIPFDDDTDWTPFDDYDLLKNLLEFGYGNNIDIRKRMPHKEMDDIRRRIDRLCGVDVAPLRAPLEVHPHPVIKYHPNSYSDEPPRYPPNSTSSKALAGYCAPRGDFETEHDNNAEVIVANLDEEDVVDELSLALTSALVDSYNERLKERFRRKRVVRDHGLLVRKYSTLTRYDTRLLVFMQLLNGIEFDLFITGLKNEEALRCKLNSLEQYRRQGVTRLSSIYLCDRLTAMRNEAIRSIHSLRLNPTSVSTAQRRVTTPLDISKYPAYQALEAKEQELCAKIRVLPESYMKFKDVLIHESVANGGIRLMTARQLIKIDVNKTRKIFNFLRDQNLIVEKKKDG